MKVVYTDEALNDLDGILTFLAEHYPTVVTAFEKRLRVAVARIGAWPQSAQEIAERPGVRVLPLTPYPYRLFYRVTTENVEVLHVRHAALRAPWAAER
jgi:toxin ParE1/3/4